MATPFPVFVERHQQRTYRAAFRVLGERAEALDVTQEALLALYRRGAGLPSILSGQRNLTVSYLPSLNSISR